MQKVTDLQTKKAVTGTIASATTDGILYIGHRGAPRLYPEHSMEGYRSTMEEGPVAIEPDCYLLSDGEVGVMHDGTVDRTTTATGDTADHSIISWRALRNDQGDTLGGLWNGLRLNVPLFKEFCAEFGNKVLIVPEAKNTGSGAAITAIMQEYGISTESAILTSFTLSELTAAIAAGYPVGLAGDAIDPVVAAAAGVEYAIFSYNVSGATVAAAVAAGLEVIIYTVDRQSVRDTFIGYGATGFYSDDVHYLRGQAIRTTDPFGSQTWAHGMLPSTFFPHRGSFVNGDRFQLASADNAYVLQGWGSPVGGNKTNNSFTIQFSVRFTNLTATRWAGIAIFDKDHDYDDGNGSSMTGQNGYHAIFRTDGSIDIYRVANGLATLVGNTTTPALATNTTYTLTLTVTPTAISLGRSGSNTATANDATYRGGYFYFTQRVNTSQFFNVTVTDT